MTTADEDQLHRLISSPLLSARIAPGDPLRELALAEVFGVSRERVRKTPPHGSPGMPPGR